MHVKKCTQIQRHSQKKKKLMNLLGASGNYSVETL